MRPKVSIIVPIYNMEKYLRRCLNSIVSQTLVQFEIIAVNDGSTDSSLEILTDLAANDIRISVVNIKNSGVSSARNTGIQMARGEYIGFVDPDDWVDKRMYEEMFDTAKKDNADIVMCSYIREFENHSKVKDFNLPEKVCYSNEDVKIKMMRRMVGPLNEEIRNPEFLDAWGTVWSKLYRADLLKENNLEFTDLKRIGTNEDTLFNIQAFYYANTFVFLSQPYYHYWRANSSSLTSGYKPNLMNQWFDLYQIIESFLKEKEMNTDFFKALNNRICLGILGLGLNTISKSNKSSVVCKVLNLKSVVNNELIKRSFKQLELSSFPIVWRAFYFCAKTRLALGLYFMLLSVDGLRKIMR